MRDSRPQWQAVVVICGQGGQGPGWQGMTQGWEHDPGGRGRAQGRLHEWGTPHGSGSGCSTRPQKQVYVRGMAV